MNSETHKIVNAMFETLAQRFIARNGYLNADEYNFLVELMKALSII